MVWCRLYLKEDNSEWEEQDTSEVDKKQKKKTYSLVLGGGNGEKKQKGGNLGPWK